MKHMIAMRTGKLKIAYANTTGEDTVKTQDIKEQSNMTASEIYVLVIAVFVVLLFGYTAINKLITTDVFIFQMRLVSMELLNQAAPYLAWGVPILELAVIGLIMPDKTRHIGLLASFFLMLTFQAYIIWLRSTGLDLPCTCGGIISSMSWVTHLIFNWVVILLIASAIYFTKRYWWSAKIAGIVKTIKRTWEKKITNEIN